MVNKTIKLFLSLNLPYRLTYEFDISSALLVRIATQVNI